MKTFLTQTLPKEPAATISHLVYLHGFRSSPHSFKAQFIAQWLGAHRPDVVWFCPQLPASPHAAADLLLNTVHAWPKRSMAVVGSSLGGFYATWLGALMQCRTVLLNPAVHPARDLVSFIGTQTAWHNPHELVSFEPYNIDELMTLYVGQAKEDLQDSADLQDATALDDPSNILNMVAKGDEVLSWQEMVARYPSATLHLIEGSDHGLSDFEQHFPALKNYLGLNSEP